MKFSFNLLYMILFFSIMNHLQLESQQIIDHNSASKIKFIGDFDNSEVEIVIRKLLRKSIMEDEYFVLKAKDTLAIDHSGRTSFMIGFKNTVLKKAILEEGDQANITIDNDSIIIKTIRNDKKITLEKLSIRDSEYEKLMKIYLDQLKIK
jgi:hypothetical protein